MPLEFPNTPANGTTNAQFVYDSAITAWRAQGSTNNVGTQIAALQNDVSTLQTYIPGTTGHPYLMATGQATVQITSGYSYGFYGTATVTPPAGRFAYQPIVTCAINTGAIGAANVSISGTTSFIAICHVHASSANVPFMYTAVQMRSTGSDG